MKYVFGVCLAVMTALSIVAAFWRPPKPDNRIELVWVTDNAPTRHETMALFNRTNPDYRVVLDYQNGTAEKVIVQSLAGVGPDIFDCYNTSGLVAYVKAGIAYDCTDDFKRMDIDLDDIWPCLKPTYTMNDRIYGHPANASAPAIWFNKRMFDEAGVPYPKNDWTWDDFLATAKKLTKRDERGKITQFGFLSCYAGNEYYLFWRLWNGRIYNAEGTRCMLDQPEPAAAVQFMQDLIYKYRVAPTLAEEYSAASTGGWALGALPLFAAEKGAMTIGGRWWLVQLRQPAFAHLKLGVAPIPHSIHPRIVGDGKTTLINRRGKHIEGALQFLKFLHSQEYSELINRQGDGLGPLMKYCDMDRFLHDPEHPSETYNAVWRDTVANADPSDESPYVNGKEVESIMIKYRDLIATGRMSGADAMREMAEKINKSIIKQLQMDPALKARYLEALRQGAPPAWDRPEDAP